MRLLHILLIISVVGCYACKKEMLDRKPSSSLTIPTTVNDFQQLLDDYNNMNNGQGLGELSADDYYVIDYPSWQALSNPIARNVYVWKKDLYEGAQQVDDWNQAFYVIFVANVILNQLESDKVEYAKPEYDQVRAQALFFRAMSYFNLSQVFCMPLDSAIMATQLGLPLRSFANVDEIKQRSTLQETYNFIEKDLLQSLQFFNREFPVNNRNRPSRVAATTLLSRLYLVMANYPQAERFADSSLALYAKLVDFNTLSTTASNPWTITGDELVLRVGTPGYSTIQTTSRVSVVDSALFASYHTNDLRRSIYFRLISGNQYGFKRGLGGSGLGGFVGIASSEVMFSKAECLARRGADSQAVDMVNSVLQKRFKKNTFTPLKFDSVGNVLDLVLRERRKDLVWRGLRWLDIRRLNRQGAGITIKRMLNNETFILPPNDIRYAMPLPDPEVQAGGLTQNQR